MRRLSHDILRELGQAQAHYIERVKYAGDNLSKKIDSEIDRMENIQRIISGYNPAKILERGYAIIRGQPKIGQRLEIETLDNVIETEVKNVRQK